MKLLVFYSYRLYNELNDDEIVSESQCSVPCPEDLKQSEFNEFVYKNYYEKIFALESDCCGSYSLQSLTIDCVKYLVEF